MKRKNLILLVIFIVVLFLANTVYPSLFAGTESVVDDRDAHLSIYSDEWDGLSSFHDEVEKEGYDTSTIISNPLILRELEHPESSLYVCVGVERAYNEWEIDALFDFVNHGGKVLIADDFGNANSFSKEVGVSFTGHKIWSQDFEENRSFILVETDIQWNEYTLLLNDPSSLKIQANPNNLFEKAQIIIETSRESYEDTNDNGRIDTIGNEDIDGEIPIGAFVDTKGNAGSIAFISDSSFMINDMWDRHDNAQYAIDLINAILGSSGQVIFDEGRHIQKTPIENSVYNLENFYIQILLTTGDPGSNWLLSAIIAIAFLNLFGFIYSLTKHPTRLRHKFDLTYEEAFVEQAPDRIADVKSILLNRIKANYNLYIPDDTIPIAYESSTKTEYNLTTKKDLVNLIPDAELIDFLLHPARYNVATRLNSIILKIDAVFPLAED